jgi:hypothetical protein
MGLIYCITFPSGKKYIGQTRQSMKNRLNQHKSSKDSTLISKAFKKYNNFEYTILQTCENAELDMYEVYFINKYETISPKGYNLSSGGQNGYRFSDETRLKCSLNARKKNNNLPMYIYETEYGYRCRPPWKSEKYFNYKFITKDLNLLLAIEYIENKDELYRQYILPKNLPKFICEVKRFNRNGFRITYPGYEKHFTSMKLNKEEKYILALEYLTSIQKKVQRLNVSGQNS